jgi:hypothetical protein
VTKEFPKSDACEMSWLQLGFIAMEQKDPKATVAAFETLLKKFPTTTAAAQAYYGIGRGNFDQKLYDKAVPPCVAPSRSTAGLSRKIQPDHHPLRLRPPERRRPREDHRQLPVSPSPAVWCRRTS